MNKLLLQPKVRTYLMDHLHTNVADFILKSHPFEEISSQELAQQLFGLQKARKKLPEWFENKNILYPPKVNLEQSSSSTTAIYKSQIASGESMIDVTGGMGVDVYAFAKAYKSTIHLELDEQLQALTAHNLEALKTNTKSYHGDGIEFLKRLDKQVDLLYVDPSRKTAASSKAVCLQDYEPNIIQHADLLLQKGKKILIKTSPMLDITAGMKELQYVAEIHVVAVKNEVRELLWLLDPQAIKLIYKAVNLETNQSPFAYEDDLDIDIAFSEPKTYVYEPNAAIMKLQAFAQVARQFQIDKLDQDAHLFTSDKLIDFPGRCFEVMEVLPFKPKEIKRKFQKQAFTVVTRNSRLTANQLRAKYQLKEDAKNYLFFTSSKSLGAIVIKAIRI
ncbi:class I SAM-dependent methyltransferase [Nonlabens ponticola]|uniref:Methyltransferase n=1 Tax=Nonlabens ponticola TaxID=2496866 RepID=A0A3S9MY27_9FLAO|nr:class I SAM-dependent methyltransferase [Nonlabens ponticola]AZQ44044.1 methyltransferase [Nonlabens ponticola]